MLQTIVFYKLSDPFFCEGHIEEVPLEYGWLKSNNWSAAVVWNSTDHAIENHVIKTFDNGLNHGLLSVKHMETFLHTQENSRN